MLSIYVLTYNEERNLRACLESITGLSDDVHIIDSHSTDRTLEIAREYGCSVHHRAFDTFPRQCNWALDNVSFKHEWILRLDADERVTPDLARELKDTIASVPSDVTGIAVKKRLYFMGRWIKHGRMYPMLRMCIHQRVAGRYDELGYDGQFVLKSGRTITAQHDFFENNLNNDLPFFTRKHMDYSENEARELINQAGAGGLTPRLFGNKIERTRWLRLNVYNRTPLFVRPFVYFIYRYLFCLGFLDGTPGLIFHILHGFWYRFYVDARIWEIRERWQEKRVEI
jgi:glycosyltransferase involved in cell wall biosynthesis